MDDAAGQKAWGASARAFGKKLSEILGERRDPAIVFEHPGQNTIPTSIYLCGTGGMVVICAGTTGYDAVVDLRYHWTRQKRLQGSHGTNDEQARAYNELVRQEAIDPCLGKVRPFTGDRCRPRGDGERRRGLRQHSEPGRRAGAGSGQAVSTTKTQEIAELFRVLGDPTRIEILRHLSLADEVACTTLDHILPVSKSTISYHIKALKNVGLLTVRKDGRWYHYTLQRDRLEALLPGFFERLPALNA